MAIHKRGWRSFATHALSIALMASIGCSSKSKNDDDDEDDSSAARGGVPASASDDADVAASTSSLQLTAKLAIMEAKSTNGTSLHGEKTALLLTGEGREVRLRVANSAFETIEQAASILCFLAQAKPWEQANAGEYQVMVNEDLCEESKGGGGGDSEGGGQKPPVMSQVFVKATRDEGKPLIALYRVPSGDSSRDTPEEMAAEGYYHVRLVIAAPPSDNAPAGVLKLEFNQIKGNGSAGQYGSIETFFNESDQYVLKVGMAGSEGAYSRDMTGIAVLERGEDDKFGGAIVSNSVEKGPEGSRESAYHAKFDGDYLRVKGSSAESYGGQSRSSDVNGCYDRNKFKTSIYRYDLTDANGKDIEMNSGFPAEFEKDGQTLHAHASYWGIHVNGGIELATGDKLYKVDWDGGSKSREEHTVFAAPGKLMKMTRESTTLGALKGVDMNYWSDEQYIVRWDGSKLAIVAKMKQSNDGEQSEEAASGDVSIPDWGLNIYISSLNASVNIPGDAALSNDTVIAYHREEVVSGTSDAPSGNLVCFANCPVMAPAVSAFARSNGGWSETSALYHTTTVNYGNGDQSSNRANNVSSAVATYTFDTSAQAIKQGSTTFALPTGFEASEGGYGGGKYDNMWSGALVPEASWSAMSDKSIDPWRMEQEISVFYRWSSGADSWNKFMSLKNAAGSFVKFDKPLDISFELTAAREFDGMTDDRVVGKTYRLTYGGPGQLWGIPWKYNAEIGHHMPLFSITAGDLGSYQIWPREGDQRMVEVDIAKCDGLPLEGMPTLEAAVDGGINNGALGDETSELRYIGGEAVE